MMKILTLLAFMSSYLFILCEPEDGLYHHYHIYVKNEAGHSIYVTDDVYDMTYGWSHTEGLFTPSKFKVDPGKTNRDAMLFLDMDWEYEIPNYYNDTVNIYIFHADTLKSIDKSLVESHKLKPSELAPRAIMRYDLTLKDLQKLNWHLTYPPTQEMSEMKIVQDSITYRDYRFAGIAEVKDVVGVVSCHDNVWRIMETKSEAQYYCTDACYYPLNMSSDMKKEGQTVRFSGKTRKVKCKEESELMGCTYYDLVLSSIEVYDTHNTAK